MKTTDFQDTASCDVVGVDRRFRAAYRLHQRDAVMMAAVRISETSVNFYKTILRDIKYGCHLVCTVVLCCCFGSVELLLL
jgi:hypothetical protein